MEVENTGTTPVKIGPSSAEATGPKKATLFQPYFLYMLCQAGVTALLIIYVSHASDPGELGLPQQVVMSAHPTASRNHSSSL